MKQLVQNRLFLGSLCILFAALLTFFIAPRIIGLQHEEITVYVASAPIEAGTHITDATIKSLSMPQEYLPEGAMLEKSAIVGQYATVAFAENDYLTAQKLSSTPVVAQTAYTELNQNNLAVSVTIKNFAAGLSAKLQPNDIVSFIAASSTEETVIPEPLQYVKVIAVTTSTATDYDTTASVETEQTLPVSITLAVTPAQAELLADLELNANLHVALVSRGDAEKAAALLRAQTMAVTETADTEEEING